MYYQKIVYILIIAITLYSCRTKQNIDNTIEVKSFPYSIELKAVQKSKSDIFNYAYIDIKLIGDYLAIVESKSDTIIKFLDKERLECLFYEVLKGNGPNEISLPGSLKVKGNQLSIIDKVKNQVLVFNINDLKKQEPFIPEKIIKFPKLSIIDAQFIDSNNMLLTGAFQEGIIGVADSLGTLKRFIGNIPKNYPRNYKNVHYFNFYNRFGIELFPSQKYFIVRSMFSDKLQVFDIDGTEVINIVGPDFINTKFDFVDNQIYLRKEHMLGYVDVVVKHKYIYGLYLGYSQNDLAKANNITSSVFVFKHTGEPVARFDLNKNIQTFDIDEENGIVFGLQLFPNNLYKFEIPSLTNI